MKLHTAKIKKEMKRRGWKAPEVARRIKRTPNAVRAFLKTGKTKGVTFDLLAKLFDLDVKDIVK